MINKNCSEKSNDINEDLKELVIVRIEAQMSPNLRLSIGGGGSLGMEEMVQHVKNCDETGKQIIESHLNFIKAQASGALISALNSVE